MWCSDDFSFLFKYLWKEERKKIKNIKELVNDNKKYIIVQMLFFPEILALTIWGLSIIHTQLDNQILKYVNLTMIILILGAFISGATLLPINISKKEKVLIWSYVVSIISFSFMILLNKEKLLVIDAFFILVFCYTFSFVIAQFFFYLRKEHTKEEITYIGIIYTFIGVVLSNWDKIFK